jgi:pSer/pThr/pTyr-binding forkhead associated (FHA) protein
LPKSVADAAVFQPVNVTSIGIPAIADIIKEAEKSSDKAGQTKTNDIHSTLKIERGESIGTEFSLSADESFIGRWDADNGIFPDIDLDAHDPEAKVSRRHARILRENGKYRIEDMGSTNGTFVNRGRRLVPGAAQPINNGDEIIVGKTFMRFFINQ